MKKGESFTTRCESKFWISVLKRSNECDSVENSQGQSKTTEVANSVIAVGTFSVVHLNSLAQQSFVMNKQDLRSMKIAIKKF